MGWIPDTINFILIENNIYVKEYENSAMCLEFSYSCRRQVYDHRLKAYDKMFCKLHITLESYDYM